MLSPGKSPGRDITGTFPQKRNILAPTSDLSPRKRTIRHQLIPYQVRHLKPLARSPPPHHKSHPKAREKAKPLAQIGIGIGIQYIIGQLPQLQKPINSPKPLFGSSVGPCQTRKVLIVSEIWDAAESRSGPIHLHLRNGVQGFQGLPSGLARQRAERGARVRWRLFLMPCVSGRVCRIVIQYWWSFVSLFLIFFSTFLRYFWDGGLGRD